MTFAIYQIRQTPKSPLLYDVAFNGLTGTLRSSSSIIGIIEMIEEIYMDSFCHLIHIKSIHIDDYYSIVSSCTKIYEHDFTDTNDLQSNLRNLISEQHPEFFI